MILALIPLMGLLATSASINVVWLAIGGAAAGFGLAFWKLIPRVIGWSLEEVIERLVTPQLDKVNHRIDSHMDTEESSFGELQKDIGNISRVLDERTQLFNHVDATLRDTQTVITKHMTEDTVQFAQAGAQLEAGQRELLGRLATVERIAERQEEVLVRLDRLERAKGA